MKRGSEVLEHYASWLCEFLTTTNAQISGIIFLQRIDSRFDVQSVLLMRALCGEESFASLAFVTTGWHGLALDARSNHDESFEERYRTDRDFAQIIGGVAKQYRFSRDHATAIHIVDALLAQGNKFKLQIQYEVLDKGCSLAETSAGQIFGDYLTARRAALEAALKDIQESLLIALREEDDTLIKRFQLEEELNRMSIAQVDRETDRISRASMMSGKLIPGIRMCQLGIT